MSVPSTILRKLIAHPRHKFVTDDQRSYSGIELVVAAMHVADAINKTTKQSHVGVLLPTSGLFPIATLATWMTGRVVVPLNYLLSKDELQYVVEDSDLDTIVTAGPMLEFLGYEPKADHLIRLDELKFKGLPKLRLPKRAKSDELACLLYTSGTSGKPKGVMLSHGNLSSAVKAAAHHAVINRHDVFLGVLPQFHCFGMIDLTLLPLTMGCRIVYTARFSPPKLLALARKHKPSVMIIIPSMYNALANAKSGTPEDFANLRYCVSGGEPLSEAVSSKFKDKFGVTINEGFGMTETSAASNWCLPEQHKPHSVGPTLPGIEARIVSQESGTVLPAEEEGELQLRGPTIMKGYYKLPEATAQAIDKDGFLSTGDMAKIDTDGHVSITGRIKEMLIVGGENVFPREIEEVLDSHPAVNASGVVGRASDSRGEVPIAFVEPAEGVTPDIQVLLNLCRDKLSGYKVPKEIRIIDQLPRNPTGKVLRRELKAILETGGENPSPGA